MRQALSILPLLFFVRAEAATISDATLGETDEKAPEISTTELRAVLAQKSAVVFDARAPREFALGHIPGALNVKGKPGLPLSQYVSDKGEVERALKGDKSKAVVLYCNGPFCGRSKRLADELVADGFTRVARYQLGMPVWRALGGQQEIELDGLRYILEHDQTAWLLDARGGSDLPRAHGLVLADAKKAKDDGRLPMDDHHTRILVVGADAEQARALAEAVAHDAFDNVAFFAGDVSAIAEPATAEPALVSEVERAKVSLAQGLTASQTVGRPISAKFELEHHGLQLSVYVATARGFAEVIVDPKTGRVARSEAITGGDDLTAAQGQGTAVASADRELTSALTKALTAYPSYRSLSVTATVRDGRPIAEIRLIKGSESRTVTEALSR